MPNIRATYFARKFVAEKFEKYLNQGALFNETTDTNYRNVSVSQIPLASSHLSKIFINIQKSTSRSVNKFRFDLSGF